MFQGIIYMAYNTINQKRYIGQTIMPLNRRKSSHLLNAKHKYDNLYFHKAINKYGESAFEWSVLENIIEETQELLKNKLNEREIYYIALYKSNDSDKGYNLTSGGESYKEQSQDYWNDDTRSGEWRKELSQKMTKFWSEEENRQNHSQHLLNYYKTEQGQAQADRHKSFMIDYYSGENTRQNKAKTSKWFVKAISPEGEEIIFISSKEPNEYFGRDLTLRNKIKNIGDKWIPTKRSKDLYGWSFEAIEKYNI